jgi:hypothetical protein
MHPIIFFLRLQNQIKLYHWMTTSYPRHVASDRLEAAIRENGDKFVEVYIGRYSRPKFSKKELAAINDDVTVLSDSQVITYLNQSITYLTKDIFKYINPEDTELINIRDNILSDINQTKYLFALQ